MKVQLIIKNDFGEFKGIVSDVTKEQYREICEIGKSFYKSNGFELTCENGDFVVFPPEIVRKSMLKIVIIEKNV